MSNALRDVVSGLKARGLPPHVVYGIAGNMAVESMYDPGINEIAPIVPGSRGGFGLNQWTGPRRRALEAEAARRGVPVSDLAFQLDYTLEELQGPELRAFNALQQTQTAEDAARVYSEMFLRPGIPHLDRRIAEARRVAEMFGGNALAEMQPQPTGPAQMQPARNALRLQEAPEYSFRMGRV